MRAPSFVANSRVPAAFGVTRPAGRARIRPAGDAIDQDPSCATSTYHNVQFLDASQTCLNTTHDLSHVQIYNTFGYPIDQYGSPMTGGSVPPASWAHLGPNGEAWYEPNSNMMLDQNGDPIGQAAFNPYTNKGTPTVATTTPGRTGVVPTLPITPTTTFNPFTFVQQNSAAIAAVTALVVVGILVLSGAGSSANAPTEIVPARARSPRRSSRRSARRNPKSKRRHASKHSPKYEADYDDETGLWCVFKEGGTHAFSSYSSREEAEEDARERNVSR